MNEGQVKAFPVRSSTRQECPLPRLLFNTALIALTTVIRQEKMDPHLEGSQLTLIYRWHDPQRKPQQVHTHTHTGSNKQIQWSCRIQKQQQQQKKYMASMYTNNDLPRKEIQKPIYNSIKKKYSGISLRKWNTSTLKIRHGGKALKRTKISQKIPNAQRSENEYG